MAEMTIPLIDVRAHRSKIGDEIDKRLAAVVEHGKWIHGPEVGEFEAAMAAFVGADDAHCLGCSNGTDALILAMQALGLPPGAAVICPSFTFVATAESVAMLGGHPVFAEIEADGFNLCPESTLKAASAAQAAGLEVVGVCAVDLFGVPANYDELAGVCEELGCWLLADAAQSFGAERNGTRVGRLSTIGTTSFFPSKPLGCYGDGGMVFTTDETLAELVRSLRVHGKGGDKYDNVRIGQNSRLDTMQAAIMLPKLGILEQELAERRRIAERYTSGLEDLGIAPVVPEGVRSAWAQYTLTTPHRDELIQALKHEGIASAVYYPTPLHRQSGYERFHLDGIDLVRTEQMSTQVVSIPMHPYLRDSEVDKITEVIRSVH